MWGVNSNDDIFYREGTFGDNGVVGCSWTNIPGKLKYVTSGFGTVWGVNSQDQIFRRTGITRTTPAGRSDAAGWTDK